MIGIATQKLGNLSVKVVGVGNAGGMITKRIVREHLPGVSCGVVNTALKDLGNCPEISWLQIGVQRTSGHGAGMDPAVGAKAAQEDANRIKDFLGENDITFLIAGFGKGTGTGATPVIGELAREQGALTIAFVTTPFAYEQECHHEIAEEGLRQIKDRIDLFVPLSNQRLFDVSPSQFSFRSALEYMDDAILMAIKAIVDVLLRPGRMNLDLADLRAIFRGAGQAAFAIGSGKGESRLAEALESLKSFPFLPDLGRSSAKSLLVSMSGGPDLALDEVEGVANEVNRLVGRDLKFAQGIHQEDILTGELRVMLMAAGLSPAGYEPPREGAAGAEDSYIRGMVPLRGKIAMKTTRGEDDELLFPDPVDPENMPAYIRRTKNGPVGDRN